MDCRSFIGSCIFFYTGFYGKESLPLMGEDGTISGSIGKDEVAAALKDCIDNSGHSLVSDYRSLWPYTNTFKPDYPYVKNAPEWVKRW
jgi:hypothetical protein